MIFEKYDKYNKIHIDELNHFYGSGHPSVNVIGYVAPINDGYILDADNEFKEYLIKKFPELNLDFDFGNGSELKLNKNQKAATLTTEWDFEDYTIVKFSFKGQLMYYTNKSNNSGICFQIDPSTITYKIIKD